MNSTNNRMAAVTVLLVAGLIAVGSTARAEDSRGHYRWKDDQGVWHFSDQVPPSDAHRARERVDARGTRVEAVSAAKTPEQLAQEAELRRWRKESNRIIAEQLDHDQALLRSFRSVEEMQHALDGKLNTIDALSKVTELNNHRFKDTLAAQEKRAADLEREGQRVPKNLVDTIETTKRQIAANDDKLRELARDKDLLRATFVADIQRFQVLKAREGTTASIKAALIGDQPSGDLVDPSLAQCTTDQCARAWELARAYLKASESTPLDVDTDRLLRGANPASEQDLSLSVVRIQAKGQTKLFLDLHCKDSGLGREACASERAHALRQGFKSFIENGLR